MGSLFGGLWGSLVTLAIFGPAGRGKPSPDSDIDILLIAEALPLGRLKRMSQFERVEQLLESWLEHLKKWI
ncbi:nucleotidyltransferase domain-containing protein [Koleobacter methoxysyntrophicus]|uniref:nucleotidyltransferase domain-containing protein n=1 Tax=Koleobacter methoxysyntrophicus TaxID=2751313 RepID=UPI0019D55C23